MQAFACVCLLLLAGFGPSTAASPGDDEAAGPKSLDICVRPNAPFFVFEDSGSYSGLEYDLLIALAESQGLEARFRVPPSFVAMMDEIEAGTCAIAAGTITVTAARRARMDFSPSYFPVRIVAVEPKASLSTKPEHLRGKRAATIAGSTYLKAIEDIGEVEKTWVESSRQMFAALERGEVDFLACDSAIVLSLIESYPQLRVTVPLSERDELAFAMPKGSPWGEPFRVLMDRLRQDGTYRKILSRYFDAEGVSLILDE